MSRKKKKRLSTEEEAELTHSPFAGLAGLSGLGGLPEGAGEEPVESAERATKTPEGKAMNRGRVDISRQTAHRGGKAVTVVANFVGVGLAEKQDLAKRMQKVCGVGGTLKGGVIEIQGDKREEVRRILEEAGFKPVFTGG